MNLPAGLINHHFEFFTDESAAHGYCLNSRRSISYAEFSPDLLRTLDKEFDRFPIKRAGARAMVAIEGKRTELEQLLICNYGGFDHRADMIDGQLQVPEFWDCPNRGKCKFEGIVCDKLETASGEFLTHREIQVVRLCATGFLDKEIAIQLNGISVKTVTTHMRNIRRKTKLFRKPDLTRFAHLNNLV